MCKKFRMMTLPGMLLMLSLAFPNQLFSQTGDSIRSRVVYVGIGFGPAQSQITNNGIGAIAGLVSGKVNTLDESVEIGYFVSRYLGASVGIGFSTFRTKLSLDSYQNKFSTVDTEKESYEMRVTGTALKEEQKIGYLTVPVCLNLRIPLTSALGFFLQPGLSLSIPVVKSLQATGTFTYKGYYPAYNVILQDLPAFGFESNKATAGSGSLNISKLTVLATASAGFDLYLQKKIQLALSVCYSKSLSQISDYAPTSTFQLSKAVGNLSSMMEGSSTATIQSVGCYVKIRYYF